MNRRLTLNLLLLSISLLLSLAIMEWVLRGYLPADMNTTWALRIPHPTLGWSLKPNTSYHYRMAEELVPVHYNSKGFHDREHSYESPAEVPRIVILGDSFMEAFSVPPGQTFYRQLEERLQESGRDAEVINLGVGGYGTLQEYMLFTEEGRRYRPDTVLLAFYAGNDLRNNSLELEGMVTGGTMKTSSRPFLLAEESGEFATTPVDYENAVKSYDEGLEAQNTLLHRMSEYSAILRAVELVMKKLSQRIEPSSEAAGDAEQFVALGMHRCEEPPEFARAWERTRRILQRLDRAVRESGARLFIFTVPARHEVEADLMESLAEASDNPAELCLQDAPAYRRLEAIAGELRIGFIDLLPAFRAGEMQGKRYFLRDRHWNAAGHALAATRVADALAVELQPRLENRVDEGRDDRALGQDDQRPQ